MANPCVFEVGGQRYDEALDVFCEWLFVKLGLTDDEAWGVRIVCCRAASLCFCALVICMLLSPYRSCLLLSTLCSLLFALCSLLLIYYPVRSPPAPQGKPHRHLNYDELRDVGKYGDYGILLLHVARAIHLEFFKSGAHAPYFEAVYRVKQDFNAYHQDKFTGFQTFELVSDRLLLFVCAAPLCVPLPFYAAAFLSCLRGVLRAARAAVRCGAQRCAALRCAALRCAALRHAALRCGAAAVLCRVPTHWW